MDDLIGDFVADTRDAFNRLSPDLERWAQAPSDRAILDAVFRFVHTVRGNAGFLAFERFERLCIPAEKALADLRDGRRNDGGEVVPRLITVVNQIGAVAAAIASGIGLSAHDESLMVERLGVSLASSGTAGRSVVPLPQRGSRTVRMPSEQFDHLAACVEAVAASHRQLLERVVNSAGLEGLGSVLTEASASVDQLSRAMTLSKLLPANRLFSGIDRIVSQTAKSLGKAARFEITGGEHMINRDIIDALRDAVVHLVRNALDHGIESEIVRLQVGKQAEGTIRAHLHIDDNVLTLSLSDDGAGLDFAAIERAAARSRIVLTGPIEALTRAELAGLVASPGLTTAQEPQQLSGLGVGLDVVKTAVEGIGGVLLVENTSGRGACFTCRVPLQMADAHAA
jgi:two-component system, chemotaxis family, sensor kinase CheA